MLQELNVVPSQGLPPDEVARRLEQHGPNQLEEHRGISPWKLLLSQFQDLMVLILLFATLVAFLSWWMAGAEGFPSDAVVILAIVLANAALGFTQEYRAEKTIEELQRSTVAKSRVLREGKIVSVEQTQLVPGDLVLVSEGDRVPADLRLLESAHLRTDESILTGESVPCDKAPGLVAEETPLAERTGSLFAGTTVATGEGKGLVVKTGSQTELGGIARTLSSTVSETTPLEKRLDALGGKIGWAVLVFSVVIGLTALVVEGKWDGSTLVRIAMFSVALAVAAVPEGLPAVLTVSLSAGARRLAQVKAVARRMAAVETLGSVTTIVTDKTGTLTHNQMTVRRLYDGSRTVKVSGDGYSSEGELSAPESELSALLEAGVLSGAAALELDEKGRRRAVGDPMDASLLVLAEKGKLDWEALRRDNPPLDEGPFSSDRARVSYLRQNGLFVKGSLEQLASRSSHGPDGQPLDEATLERFREAELEFSQQAYRSLAIARRREIDPKRSAQEQEEQLTLLGLAAFEDPPRAEVKPALEECERAGIRVMMCTGDHPATAAAIAHKVGLGSPDEEALTGAQLEAMEDQEFDQALRHHHVLARLSPHQKLRVVESLIRQGEVAAMTGDGVNDAPSLKKVHVGIAMGHSGTAVAVEASDLVLLDDNFTTIVKAVEEGRSVFQNIQRFIAFLFSGNLGVVLAMFVGTILAGVFGLRYEGDILLPLSAAQILWMNLVTDGAPALAFALGRSAPGVMDIPPRRPDSPILERTGWVLLAVTGSVLAGVFLLVLDVLYAGGVWTVHSLSPVYARSAAFYTLVTARLMNSLNFMDLHGSVLRASSWRNKYVPAAALFSWLLTLGVLYFPPLTAVFGLTSLEFSHLLGLTVALPVIVLLPAELVKLRKF